MATNGQGPSDTPNRKTALIVGAIVAAMLVFGLGYLLGSGNDEQAEASPATTAPPTTEAPSPTETESETSSPTASPVATDEPASDTLPDGRYFVQLTDIQGGEEGPLLLQYDLAYFLTGEEANQAAADRGLETPVPNDYFIVNDNPKLRTDSARRRVLGQVHPRGLRAVIAREGARSTVPRVDRRIGRRPTSRRRTRRGGGSRSRTDRSPRSSNSTSRRSLHRSVPGRTLVRCDTPITSRARERTARTVASSRTNPVGTKLCGTSGWSRPTPRSSRSPMRISRRSRSSWRSRRTSRRAGAASLAAVPHDWDAASYDRLPIPMTGWGLAVLDRLPLRGDERVLDAGCGTGQVTEALRERLPRGDVVALDASPSMLERARMRLGDDRIAYVTHDLLEPIPIEPVDAILSTATFHWVPDHDRLFANLALVLQADGPLAAQCGGAETFGGSTTPPCMWPASI